MLAVAQMYVEGVSTRKVTEITRELCGLDISSSQVSRAAKLLDKEIAEWQTRELSECRYLILDARYEKLRHGGSVRDCAVFMAVGVGTDGKRRILGVSAARSTCNRTRRATCRPSPNARRSPRAFATSSTRRVECAECGVKAGAARGWS